MDAATIVIQHGCGDACAIVEASGLTGSGSHG